MTGGGKPTRGNPRTRLREVRRANEVPEARARWLTDEAQRIAAAGARRAADARRLAEEQARG